MLSRPWLEPSQTQTIPDIPAGTSVSLAASAVTGYYFVNWTGAPVHGVTNSVTAFTMNNNYSITGNFAQTAAAEYDLTISSTAGGSVTVTINAQQTVIGAGQTQTIPDIPAGTSVSLAAGAVTGYYFVNWTGAPVHGVTNASTTFTMNGNYSITANFAQTGVDYDLTISSTAGGSVTVTINAQQTVIGAGQTQTIPDIPAGTSVSLAAGAVTGYYFVNWTGAPVHGVTNASTTFTMNNNYSVTANFAAAAGAVTFPDPNLEAAIREAIGKPTGPIYEAELAGLTALSATRLSIVDLTGLEHCISLTSLDLSRNRIGDISPLSGLTSLTWLDLSFNLISDVSPLAGLTNLKWLYLHNNQISIISPLATLSNLTYLFLHANRIGDISPLAGLTKLTRLLLFANQISDISPLASLTNLEWLYVYRNLVTDISPLAALTNLTQLDLSYNQIGHISSLANLVALTYLSLSWNQLSDISPLAGLTELMWLYLDGNQISDIYPLVDNDGLGVGDRVFLEGNPLSDDSLTVYIPELEARGVIVLA
jgi:large repetitive protein